MKSLLIPALAVAALTGCANRNVDSLEAVKQGVIKDLSASKDLNIGAMDVNVVSVSFRDKEADAVVSFATKGAPASTGMTMRYTMERQGSDWHIKSRAQSDLQKHAAQPQPGSMGGAMGGDGGDMPPGHPPMDGAPAAGSGGSLPAGHPPLDK